jgi:hypothetical protein
MGRPAAVIAGCAAALAVLAGPAPIAAHDVPSQAEVSRAVRVWKRYAECEKARRFEPCFALLSRNVTQAWDAQGRGRAADYAAIKDNEAVGYEAFNLLRVRKSPARVVLVVRVTGREAGRPFTRTHEYALLQEGDEWKIDGKREGLHEALP